MKHVKVSMAGRCWAIAGAFSAGLLLAVAIRYGVLENEAQDQMCRAGRSNGWCSMRAAVGWSIHYQVFGLTALFLGIAGWLPKLRWLAFPGLLLAGCGLLIYNTTYAAVGFIVALLAALHSSASAE